MAQATHHHFTFDEYLVLEEDSGTKHEFLGGQVWAVSGGSPEHAAVTVNVAALWSRTVGAFTFVIRIRFVGKVTLRVGEKRVLRQR